MSEAVATQTSFDYGSLDATTRREVIAARNRCRGLEQSLGAGILAMGKELRFVRERLDGKGQFPAWLKTEFGWSQSTAYNYMSVAEVFGDFPTVGKIAPRALYALASGSTPQEIRDQFVAQAERGEVVTHKQVKEAIEALEPDNYSPRDSEADQFWCDECGQLFTESCWHCAGCDQHWQAALNSCPDCGNPQTGVIESRAEELSALRTQSKAQPLASRPEQPHPKIIDVETGEIIDPEEEEEDELWHEQRRPLARRPERLEVKRQTPQDIALIAARNERVELERMRDETHRNLKAVEGIDYGQLDARTQDEWRGCLELARSIVWAMERYLSE